MTAAELADLENAIQAIVDASLLLGFVVGVGVGAHLPSVAAWVGEQVHWWLDKKNGRRRWPR